MNEDFEVSYTNGKLVRKVALFSFHIYVYQSKRYISKL